MFRRGWFALTIVAGLAWAGASHAGGEARTHDGFFLRLSAGFASTETKISDATGKLKLSGSAGDVNLAVGGVIAPNLAIHGTIFGWSASDPDAEITVYGVGSGSGSISGTVTMSAVGGGVTYYIMPANFYLSGSVGLARLRFDSNTSGVPNGDSDSGFALDLTAGKEWWVGRNWGLGAAGDIMIHSVPDGGLPENWAGPSFGLRFTATMN